MSSDDSDAPAGRCPDPLALRRFSLGDLPVGEFEWIAHHINGCGRCEETLGQLSSLEDSVVASLRDSSERDTLDEDQRREIVRRVASLGQEFVSGQRSDSKSPSSERKLPGLESFARSLADCGLVDAGNVASAVERLPATDHPSRQLADELVRVGLLTDYQASALLLGAGDPLVLGEYVILDRLGSGGMGHVFRARHRRMDRIVAIKLLSSAVTISPQAIERFHREMRVAAKLEHPNIVAALDAGQSGDVHFLVLQFVDGCDLSTLGKREGPCGVTQAIEFTLQAARGLAYAHDLGVIHRDVKPANLLLSSDGTVKILDLGLARIDASGAAAIEPADLTCASTLLGTIDYMAPEQALNTKLVDARADIYSLGCTLHYLLTGQAVYGGASVMEKLVAHRENPIPNLKLSDTSLSDPLNAIFRKMVAKRVGDRYSSMNEVIADLEQVRAAATSNDHPADSAIAASPIPQAMSSAGRSRNGRPLLLAGAAAGFLLLLLGVVIIIRNQQGEEIGRVESPNGTMVEVHAEPNVATTKSDVKAPILAGVAATAGKSPTVKRVVPQPLIAPFDPQRARDAQEDWANYLGTTAQQANSIDMKLVLIPASDFAMGSTPEQLELGRKMARDAKLSQSETIWRHLEEESPQHRVKLTRPYWMGMTEVTIGQFKKFIEATKYSTEAIQYGFGNSHLTKADATIEPEQKALSWHQPGFPVTNHHPVTQVTWGDAVKFCNWLSEREKFELCYRPDTKDGWKVVTSATGYRLPTEAEWSFACRGGTATQFYFGDESAILDAFGWYRKNSGLTAQPVGLKAANAFGLFDLHGNAAEWCQDWSSEEYYSNSPLADPPGAATGFARINRGGHWKNSAIYCRSETRSHSVPTFRSSSLGFRVVRTIRAESTTNSEASAK